MNLQQQREEARRRRLINRSLMQHRKLYFDDVRRSLVTGNRLPPSIDIADQQDQPPVFDGEIATRVLKLCIVVAMAALLIQHATPLLQVAARLLPSGLID